MRREERIFIMKKFVTLAEVLITLTIIGVVAMMTLPALMTNVQEQQAKTGIKKGINTLTEAAQMSNAIAGFDYGSFANTETGEDAQSIFGMFRSRIQVDMTKSTTAFNADGEEMIQNRTNAAKRVLTGGTTTDSTTYTVMFFKDGSALAFKPTDTVAVAGGEGQPVQLPCNYTDVGRGFIAYYDINGEKAPNLLSNCESDVNTHIGTQTPPATLNAASVDTTACENKNSRIIKDQFALFFNGSYVMPANAATKWAYDN